ncbi:MAG: AAA family ATPase, partial [Actinomycetota bacterium]
MKTRIFSHSPSPGARQQRSLQADLEMLGDTHVLRTSTADVAAAREVARKARWGRAGVLLGLIGLFLWTRVMAGRPLVPSLPDGFADFVPVLFLVGILTAVLILPLLAAGRSPHVLYRPSEIDVSLDDVKGMGVVMDEVVKSLNLFLAFKTFRERMGGTPRRALLFEGPPGTGKTYMAKALAREARVPFLFVSSSAFQSMYYGATNRKIRSYFRDLRKAARRHGGAIGFIEEIDAIGAARSGMGGG